LSISISATFAIASAQTQVNGVPSFDDAEYFVGSIVRNTSTKPNLNSEFALNFITRITEAAKQEPNFAGRYSLTSWGCGTSCQSGAVVNLVTGEVIAIPTASWGYEYHVHSALLVLNPVEQGESLDERPDYGRPEYFLFHGKDFLEFTLNWR